MKSEGLGLRGHIKVWITRENGFKELVFEDHNAIQAAYAQKIVDALQSPTNYTLDNLFNGNVNPPTTGEDGIAIKDNGGLWYEMIMATPVVSADRITFVGTFTGVGITVAAAADVNLGHDYQAPFTTIIALPSAWASQAVLNTETLTIEWIVSHEVS